MVLSECFKNNFLFLVHFQMFPNGMLESFRTKVSEDKYYEALLYESVLGISMSNYDEAVEYIRQALSYEPCLMSSLNKLINCDWHDDIYSNKVAKRLAGEFGIELKSPRISIDKCFEEDDVDGYRIFYDEKLPNMKFEDRNEAENWERPHDVFESAVEAIKWDAVRILKYIISNDCINHDLDQYAIQSLGGHAVRGGNYEIIHILEHCGADFGKCFGENYCRNHHDIIEWIAKNHGDDKRPRVLRKSLMSNSKTSSYEIALEYDLPSILSEWFYKEEDHNCALDKLTRYGCLNALLRIADSFQL